MSRMLLQLVLRHSEGLKPGPDTDADLVQRFARSREEAAFAELLHRHGPMVWAVCRHLLADEADTEDAFQATFLALVRSAGSVRNAGAISSWLHGVAVRVATKVKRSAARRRQREARAAEPEADRPVPEATWNALLAAVHEEVQNLPDSLRAAFVLCELEGVRQPDAATRLGWKIGTLTGRLTRARQLLVQRLSSRGLAPAIAGGSLGLSLATATAAVPEALIDNAMSLNAGGVVSPAILNLVKEITPMAAMRAKLIAATVVIAGGLSAVLFPMAVAQPMPGTGPGFGRSGPELPPGAGAPGLPGATPGFPGGGPQPGAAPGGFPGAGGPPPGMSPPGSNSFPGGLPGALGSPGFGAPASSRAPWEYTFVAGGFSKDFAALFTQMGNEGWEYCGSFEPTKEQLSDAMKAHPERVANKGGSNVTLIFKRSKGAAPRGFGGGGASGTSSGGGPGGGGSGSGGSSLGPPPGGPPLGGSGFGPPPGGGNNPFSPPGGLSGPSTGGVPAPAATPLTIVALKNATAAEMSEVLQKVFRNGVHVTADPRTNSLIIRADEKSLEDVKALIQKLDAQSTKP